MFFVIFYYIHISLTMSHSLVTKDLSITIESKQVLNNISLTFESGKNYCVLGKNGSWKSSLALSVMWHPSYEITNGTIICDGEVINELDAHERAQRGIFLAFQSIPDIKWVKLFEFLRSIYSAKTWQQSSFIQFKKIIIPLMEQLDVDKEFLWRDVNVWFSGGERRKVELLQLTLLQPRYIFLDEVDSWLDVDAFKQVAALMQQSNTQDNSFIIITHYFAILEYIPVDWVYVLSEWNIIEQWTVEIAHRIQSTGFGW